MTPQQFKAIRQEYGLTQVELERLLGYAPADGRRIRGLESGEYHITERIEKLMRILEAQGPEVLQ